MADGSCPQLDLHMLYIYDTYHCHRFVTCTPGSLPRTAHCQAEGELPCTKCDLSCLLIILHPCKLPPPQRMRAGVPCGRHYQHRQRLPGCLPGHQEPSRGRQRVGTASPSTRRHQDLHQRAQQQQPGSWGDSGLGGRRWACMHPLRQHHSACSTRRGCAALWSQDG